VNHSAQVPCLYAATLADRKWAASNTDPKIVSCLASTFILVNILAFSKLFFLSMYLGDLLW
jgi:hypothetical protein